MRKIASFYPALKCAVVQNEACVPSDCAALAGTASSAIPSAPAEPAVTDALDGPGGPAAAVRRDPDAVDAASASANPDAAAGATQTVTAPHPAIQHAAEAAAARRTCRRASASS